MNKKLTSLILTISLLLSMVVGLTACNETSNNAIFYFLKDGSDSPVQEEIVVDDFRADATIYDVFRLAEDKYVFGAELVIKKEGIVLDAIYGKGLAPTKVQNINVYSDKEPKNKDGAKIKTLIINDKEVTFYSTNYINELKLEANVKYLFAVEDDDKFLDDPKNVKLEVNLSEGNKKLSTPIFITDIKNGEEYMFATRGNEILKMNKKGEIIDRELLSGTINGKVNPIVGGGKIICPTEKSIDAFDINLKKLWSFTESDLPIHRELGKIQSKILFDTFDVINTNTDNEIERITEENIYVNFCNVNEKGETLAGDIIGINAKTGKPTTFSYRQNKSFEKGGAVIIDNYIVIRDINEDGKNIIKAVDKITGKTNNSMSTIIKGEVQSEIVYSKEANSIFFTMSEKNSIGEKTSSYLSRIWLKCTNNKFNGTFGKYSEVKTKYKNATSIPVLYKDRLYISSGEGSFNEKTNKGAMQVINIGNMSEIYSVDTKFECQAKPYIKVVDNGNKEEIYVLFTLNANTGDLFYIVDSALSSKGVVKRLRVSQHNNVGYGGSDIVLDKNGVMYFTNYSNTIFGYELKI